MAKPQVIRDAPGNPEFAVIPWMECQRLATADTEAGLSDEDLYDQAKAADEELFPIEVADRLLMGDNAIRVYRDYRGLTQKQLAEKAGINAAYLSQLERGQRTGSARTLMVLAKALGVAVDALL